MACKMKLLTPVSSYPLNQPRHCTAILSNVSIQQVTQVKVSLCANVFFHKPVQSCNNDSSEDYIVFCSNSVRDEHSFKGGADVDCPCLHGLWINKTSSSSTFLNVSNNYSLHIFLFFFTEPFASNSELKYDRLFGVSWEASECPPESFDIQYILQRRDQCEDINVPSPISDEAAASPVFIDDILSPYSTYIVTVTGTGSSGMSVTKSIEVITPEAGEIWFINFLGYVHTKKIILLQWQRQ